MSGRTELLSIIVPVYNEGATSRALIDRLLAIDLPLPREILVAGGVRVPLPAAARFDIEPEITARLLRRGHRIHEVAVRYEARSRREGKKIRWRDGLRALQVLVRERFRPGSVTS